MSTLFECSFLSDCRNVGFVVFGLLSNFFSSDGFLKMCDKRVVLTTTLPGLLQICNWCEQQSSKNGTTWSAISTAQKVAVANFMRLLFKSITNLLLAFNHLHEKDGDHFLPIFTCHPCFWCLCNFELSNGFQEKCNTRDVCIPGVVQKCQVLNYEAAKKKPLVGRYSYTYTFNILCMWDPARRKGHPCKHYT